MLYDMKTDWTLIVLIFTIFSNLEFDLNVNNTVGIRNTFLLRAYACGG